MKTSILAGLTEQQKEEMRASFLAGGRFRDHLISLLRKKCEDAKKSVRNKDAYEISNWAYKQADYIGYERAIEEIISLLK